MAASRRDLFRGEHGSIPRVDERALIHFLTKARDKSLQVDMKKATFFADFEAMLSEYSRVISPGDFGPCNGAGLGEEELRSKLHELMLHGAASKGLFWVRQKIHLMTSDQRAMLDELIPFHDGMVEAIAYTLLCCSGLSVAALDKMVQNTVILDAPDYVPVLPHRF